MPHQCVRCGKVYSSTSSEILKGCGCGGRLFFFMKEEKLAATKEIVQNLTEEEKVQMERDVLEIVGAPKTQEPVILDLESIRVLGPGKYELDIVQLLNDRPVVYRLEEGRYIIDIAESLRRDTKSILKRRKK